MKELFKAPKGTYDVVAPFSILWLAVRDALSTPPKNSGYSYIETPIFEDTALFVRGVGESTDVVSKEMYTFEDKSGTQVLISVTNSRNQVATDNTLKLEWKPLDHQILQLTLKLFGWQVMPSGRYLG